MAKLDDGGPAFPRTTFDAKLPQAMSPYEAVAVDGMSLRDYFAVNMVVDGSDWPPLAVMEMLAGRQKPSQSEAILVLAWICDVEAALKYKKADAMLRMRIK